MQWQTASDAARYPRHPAPEAGEAGPRAKCQDWKLCRRSRLVLVMFVLMVFAAPPLGVLSTNEEAYLNAAAHSYGVVGLPSESAALGGMSHALVFSIIAGVTVDHLGFEGAQIVLRVLVALLYAVAFATLFDRIGLRLPGAVIVMASFLLLGQEIVGGEWLLGGVEPKAFAYPLAIGGIAFGLTGAIHAAILLLAAATWFHLLVGGYGLALMSCALLLVDRRPKALLMPFAVYLAAIAPLGMYLLAHSYGQTFSASDGVSSSWISTFVRNPHHAMPYASKWSFSEWLPGLAATFALLVSVWFIAPQLGRTERLSASIVFAASSWILIAAIVVLVDRSGSVGVFLPFRVSSLALLFVLIVTVQLAQGLQQQPWPRMTVAAAFILSVLLLATRAGEEARQWALERDARRERAELAELVTDMTERSSVILVTAKAEPHVLWLERRTGRAAYVFFKFFPSEPPRIAEWYNRIQLRSQVESGQCNAAASARFDFILATEAELSRTRLCGQRIAASGRFVLLRRDPGQE
jgi:hypothetical protein